MNEETLVSLVGREAAEQVLSWHREALRRQAADHALTLAITQAGGRNRKAIRALVDEAAIAQAEDPQAAAQAAVAQLRRDSGYLFAQALPAPGTGLLQLDAPVTQQTLANMSMAEYRRYRRGQ